MYKHILTVLCLIIIITCCQSTKEIQLINKKENKYAYRDRFEITLPLGYFLSSSIIYNQDSIKVGEVVLDNEKLLNSNNGFNFVSISKKSGSIKTEEIEFSADCFECEFIKSDSIRLNELTWFYVVQKSDYEGDFAWGYWNMFEFCTVNNGKVTLITFYNKDLDDFSIDSYAHILKSINFD